MAVIRRMTARFEMSQRKFAGVEDDRYKRLGGEKGPEVKQCGWQD